MTDAIVRTATDTVLVQTTAPAPIVVRSTQTIELQPGATDQIAATVVRTLGATLTQKQVLQTASTGPQGIAGPQGPQGAQGVPGPASGTATITATAGSNLTYPCVVAIVDGVAHYADPANTADMTASLAITTQAALAGASVVCATELSITEPAWSWTPGRIYLSTTPGQLTQSPSASAATLEVGRAINPTTIVFDIQPAIL